MCAAFTSTSVVGVIGVAFVYLLHTHMVCLAWQPAGLDNNKASGGEQTADGMGHRGRGFLQWPPVTCQAGGQSRREQKPVCLEANWKISVLVVFLSHCLSPG